MKRINWQDPTAVTKSSKEWNYWFLHIGKVLVCLIIFIVSIYSLLWPQIRVNYIFKPVTCVVLDKKLKFDSKEENAGFLPQFLVIYRVDNKTHISWVYDILGISMTDPDVRKDALKQYSSGYPYTCWYDPAHPEVAVLKHTWNRSAILFCVMAGIVLIVFSVSFVRWIILRRC